MNEPFSELLAVGGKSNSLGKVPDVIEAVLQNKLRIAELYQCLFDDDAWVRMRAADSLEKICRVHPDWLQPYIDPFLDNLSSSNQPSIQWHLAQIYRQVELSPQQQKLVIEWLENLLSSPDADWIVSANAMDTLAHFVNQGSYPVPQANAFFVIQTQHKSKSVIRRATKLIETYTLEA